MRLQVKAHHGHLSDSVRAYAEKRLSKLDRRLHDATLVELTLSREGNPSIPDDHTAEAIVYTKGPNLVARVAAATYEAARRGASTSSGPASTTSSPSGRTTSSASSPGVPGPSTVATASHSR